MSRPAALFTLLTIIVLLVIGVVGFVALGQQAISRHEDMPISNTAPVAQVSQLPVPGASSWEPRPSSRLPLKLLTYSHFTIGYDEVAKNPAWVAYRLAGAIKNHGTQKRPSTFATDFKTAAHVSYSDYSNSGFDRGHMCPAYALFSRFGDEGMKATFIMSNVIPQYHGLNAGEWEQLEGMIAGRSGEGDGWAATFGSVWVINGPIYDKRPAPDQLRNGTWIPISCFSVVLRQTEGHWDALAFIMPNVKTVDGPVSRYLTRVATINRATSLDLLAGMEEVEKSQVEDYRATELWRK